PRGDGRDAAGPAAAGGRATDGRRAVRAGCGAARPARAGGRRARRRARAHRVVGPGQGGRLGGRRAGGADGRRRSRRLA
ncbi:MAG: hypothetical protein GEV09_26810, partial [Pseudonocardiaceae bacterium]|nr:hypothetical protein [Pseudonocardiaceae bacterium]